VHVQQRAEGRRPQRVVQSGQPGPGVVGIAGRDAIRQGERRAAVRVVVADGRDRGTLRDRRKTIRVVVGVGNSRLGPTSCRFVGR